MKKLTPIHARRIHQAGLIAIICLAATHAYAQKRDNLTDAETDLIRFHQEIDKRIDVFIKAADRRFAIINGTVQPSTKKLMKDEPDWGDLPTGTHAALLSDIAGILDEAITNIDDVSRRDERSPLVPRALRKLTSAANGYLNQIAALRSKTNDADEIAAMERVADNANQIIEAGSKLGPAPPPEDDKKKKKP
jgi:elongation factor P hydroxylase